MSKGDAMWACLVLLALIFIYGITGEGDYQDQAKIEEAKAGLILGKRYKI